MDKFKRSGAKRILFIEIGVILVFSLIFVVVNRWQYSSSNQAINSTISGIIEKIQENYPEVTERDILEILENRDKLSNNFLSKYGYTEQSAIVLSYYEKTKSQMWSNVFILLALGFSLVITFLTYVLIQNKKIDEIKSYIKAVSNKNYSLDISDNCEDELSKLRNELYKMTVMLKETAELSAKEKVQLSDSIADISHQIKTPITSIRIMIDNIKDNPDMDEKTRSEFINDISNQVDWISSLVISLLKLAKLDAGVISLKRQTIRLNDIVENVIKNVAVLVEIKGIKIVTDIPENAGFLGDYNWELEALTNIVKNCVEHSSEKSNIYISSERNTFFQKLIIKDEGSGISKEDIRHIFERFYKSKNSGENSIGIGLALAKSIIEKDDGYIEVISEVGKGTTFEIKYIAG